MVSYIENASIKFYEESFKKEKFKPSLMNVMIPPVVDILEDAWLLIKRIEQDIGGLPCIKIVLSMPKNAIFVNEF